MLETKKCRYVEIEYDRRRSDWLHSLRDLGGDVNMVVTKDDVAAIALRESSQVCSHQIRVVFDCVFFACAKTGCDEG